MIDVGQHAPDFTLPDQDGQPRRLADYRGRWVVLYFYPKDDTPGCTTEACEFTAALSEFADLDAVVLGCSPDPPESHRAFADKHGLAITLLSDPGHEVMQRYGAWGEKTLYGKKRLGVIRTTVLIDPEGHVAHRWSHVRAAGHAAAVRERLAQLRAAASGR